MEIRNNNVDKYFVFCARFGGCQIVRTLKLNKIKENTYGYKLIIESINISV